MTAPESLETLCRCHVLLRLRPLALHREAAWDWQSIQNDEEESEARQVVEVVDVALAGCLVRLALRGVHESSGGHGLD